MVASWYAVENDRWWGRSGAWRAVQNMLERGHIWGPGRMYSQGGAPKIDDVSTNEFRDYCYLPSVPHREHYLWSLPEGMDCFPATMKSDWHKTILQIVSNLANIYLSREARWGRIEGYAARTKILARQTARSMRAWWQESRRTTPHAAWTLELVPKTIRHPTSENGVPKMHICIRIAL